jgi:hypothetical protein
MGCKELVAKKWTQMMKTAVERVTTLRRMMIKKMTRTLKVKSLKINSPTGEYLKCKGKELIKYKLK